MTETRLADIIEPEVFADYLSENTAENTKFWGSGIIVTNDQLTAKANSGGDTLNVPFWKDLTDAEPNYSNDNPASNSTPGKITAGKQIARMAYANYSWSAMDLASEIAGSNAMERIADRVDAWWGRQLQARMIQMANGVLADNVANDSGDMVHDASTTSAGTPAASNKFTRTNFTSAAFTLGDAFEDTGAIGVHSVIYQQMVDNEDIDFVADSEGNLTIPTYLGKRVIYTDAMPAVLNGITSEIEYTSVLFGAGAFGFGEGSPTVPVEVDRDPSSGNGGGQEVLYSRKSWLLHPFGFEFTSSSVAGDSPTLAEMATAANWNRVFDERKQVPIAFLITN